VILRRQEGLQKEGERPGTAIVSDVKAGFRVGFTSVIKRSPLGPSPFDHKSFLDRRAPIRVAFDFPKLGHSIRAYDDVLLELGAASVVIHPKVGIYGIAVLRDGEGANGAGRRHQLEMRHCGCGYRIGSSRQKSQ